MSLILPVTSSDSPLALKVRVVDADALFPEYKVEAFTAANGGKYICAGTFAITNPASGGAGQSYQVIVLSGAITINGVAYAPSRFPILVAHNGSSWQTLPQTLTGDLALPGATFGSNNALTGAVGDARYGNPPAVKLADTTRASTTSPTADPDLSLVLTPGVWRIRSSGIWHQNGSSNAGCNMRLAGSAVINSALSNGQYTNSIGANLSTVQASSRKDGTNEFTLPRQLLGGNTTQPGGAWTLDCTLTVTTGGTIHIEWSQAASQSTGTTVAMGAILQANRIA